MQLKEHVRYGAIASVGLAPFSGTGAVFFFLGSVFIDLDHYVDFLYYARFRDWSPRNMFAFHGQMSRWRDKPNICALEAFHTAEFLLGLLGVAFYFHSQAVLLLLAGMLFHLALDLYNLHHWGHSKIRSRALSFVEYGIRQRRMRKKGVEFEKIFFDAYAAACGNRAAPAPSSLDDGETSPA